jgi:hypothetical protein
MKSFCKVVNPGKINVNGRLRPVFVKIEYADGRLSLRGVVGPWHSGNCAGSCGQCQESLANITQYTNGWSKADVRMLIGMWNAWHLNDMKPGCTHQDGWDALKELTLESGKKKRACHVYPEEHPEGLLCRPCPVCGYKYGSAWTRREVPEDVLEFLSGLPDTKKEPAWV